MIISGSGVHFCTICLLLETFLEFMQYPGFCGAATEAKANELYLIWGHSKVGNVRLCRCALQRQNIHADTQQRDRKGEGTSREPSTIIFLSLVVGLIRQTLLENFSV